VSRRANGAGSVVRGYLGFGPEVNQMRFGPLLFAGLRGSFSRRAGPKSAISEHQTKHAPAIAWREALPRNSFFRHILFVNGGALKAQSFDSERLQLTGQPVAIAQHELEVGERAWFRSGFSVAEAGIPAFQSCTDFAPELVWTDSMGNEQGRIRQRGSAAKKSQEDFRSGRTLRPYSTWPGQSTKASNSMHHRT
jgi:hypothetical protein